MDVVAYLVEYYLFNASLYEQLGALVAWEHGDIQSLQQQQLLLHANEAAVSSFLDEHWWIALTAPESDAVFLFMMAFISA